MEATRCKAQTEGRRMTRRMIRELAALEDE
jgi:hypothetical protein